MPLRVKKNKIESPAPTGKVTTQETIIRPTTEKSIEATSNQQKMIIINKEQSLFVLYTQDSRN